MAKYAWPAGSTSKTILIFVQDSSSNTGAGKTGVSVANTNIQQIRVLTSGTVQVATVSTTNLTALTDAYLLGGIFPVDAVNAPGWYRFDIPDAALSVGAITAAINIMDAGANNIAQLPLEIQLQYSPADTRAWAGGTVSASNLAVVDFSTRLNVNVQQWAGNSTSADQIPLWTSITQLNVTQWAGVSVTNNNIVLRSTSATLIAAANVYGWAGTSVSASNLAIQDFSTRLNVNVQQWAGKSTSTSDLAAFSVSQTVLTAAAGAGVNVTAWAGVSVSASNLAVVDFSTRLNVNVQQWAGNSTSSDQIPLWTSITQLNVTQWNGVSVSTNNIAIMTSGSLADSVLTRAMTEAYGTISAQFTPAQAFYQIWAMLHNFSISAASLTVLKLDHATSAMTFSLDSAATPTKLERVT